MKHRNKLLTKCGEMYILFISGERLKNNYYYCFQLQLQYSRELRAVAAARDSVPGGALVSCGVSPRLMEKVGVAVPGAGAGAGAGYCDVVYVSELGCGINRGAMNFGRLYQVRKVSSCSQYVLPFVINDTCSTDIVYLKGKYVPPDRSDIVTNIIEKTDEDTEAAADQNVDTAEDVGETANDVNEEECEEITADASCPDADIDLD